MGEAFGTGGTEEGVHAVVKETTEETVTTAGEVEELDGWRKGGASLVEASRGGVTTTSQGGRNAAGPEDGHQTTLAGGRAGEIREQQVAASDRAADWDAGIAAAAAAAATVVNAHLVVSVGGFVLNVQCGIEADAGRILTGETKLAGRTTEVHN